MLTPNTKVIDMTLRELYITLIIANRGSNNYDKLITEDNAEDIAFEVDMLILKQKEVLNANA